MEYLEAKINQLVVEKSGRPSTSTKNKQNSFVRSFVTKPAKPLEGKLGKIFGLIEIESDHPQIPDLINLIIEEIKNNYYQQTEFNTGDDSTDTNDYFEIALKKTNLAVASFIESEQISLDLEKVNIIIALSHKSELHFTLIGNIGVILFYNIARSNYRIINILETTQSSLTTPDPLKFFSQVTSGKIRPRDILFITTSNILDYFSLERIKNIITDQLPIDGVVELKQSLEEIDSKQNFGAVVLELGKVTGSVKKDVDIKTFNYRQAASKDSIKDLLRTEKETEKLLTPSILPEMKKYVTSFKKAFQNYLDKTKTSTTDFYRKQKIVIKPNLNIKPNLKLGKKISQIGKIGASSIKSIKKISSPFQRKTKKTFINIGRHPFWNRLVDIAKRLFGNLASRFQRLPNSSKILLVVTVVLVILFSQSIIWIGIKNNREQKLEQFNQVIIEVVTKKNNAESSLIYRDEGQARKLLAEAKNLLENLEPETENQKQQVAMLIVEIEQQLQKLRHIIEIIEPVQIINFANLDSQANIAKLVVNNRRTIYTQNHSNQSIYKANLDTRVMSAIYSPNSNTGNLTLGTMVSNNEILFFNDSMSTFRLNPANDALQTIAMNINDNANITDITTYNNRLYLLDAANNQIYRYSKTTSGYGNIREWISEGNPDLTDATSLTVDGSIYVLKSNGEIIKFLNGAQQDWKINSVDPPFKFPTKIKTTEDSNYLYILDPPTKRLVILDKDGTLINQYTSESFNDLKDFIVDEREKEIYILNGSSIFGISAEHLE